MLTGLFPRKSLDQIALRCKTDKSSRSHNFAAFYDQHLGHLRDRPLRFLEIGVGRGSSIRMWTQYFKKGEMFAIECEARRSRYRFYGAEVFIGRQEDRTFLKKVMEEIGPLDLIIDDGSHRVDHQQDTLGFLFPHLKAGGHYIIEDIHTSYPDSECDFGLREDGSNSTHTMLKNFQESGRFHSLHMSEEEAQTLSDSVENCHIFAHQDPAKHLTALLDKRL